MYQTIIALVVLLIAGSTPFRMPQADIAAIRALRLENNHAIESHDVTLMRKAWAPTIRVIESDGTTFSGSGSLAASYASVEFNDKRFVAYVRRPTTITISAEGKSAAESGFWTAIFQTAEARSFWNLSRFVAKIRRGLAARITLPGEPCSGLANGFGSIWVPLCGTHPSLARVDPVTNSIAAVLPIGPALSEGGITASNDSVWMTTGNGELARINPKTNRVRQTISLAPGSDNPLYSDGIIWITSGDRNLLTALDASSGQIVATIAVGSKPRFLAAGDGAVYTLNQGDGSVSKIDAKEKRVTATIAAGIPGGGGEITYGAGSAWATIIGVPLTQILSNSLTVRQWGGRGGDAVRFGHASIWLTDYYNGILWRIPISHLKKHTIANAAGQTQRLRWRIPQRRPRCIGRTSRCRDSKSVPQP